MRLLTLTLGMLLSASTLLLAQTVKSDSIAIGYSYEEDYVLDNSYAGGGITGLFSHGSNTGKAKFYKMLNPSIAFFAGKHISPYSDVRATLGYSLNSGTANHDNKFGNYRWHSIQLALSYRPSISNILAHYNENRNWSINAVAGIGGNVAFGYSKKEWNKDNNFNRSARALLDLHVGLSFEYRIRPKWTIGVEAIEYFVDNNFDGNNSDDNLWDRHANLMVSLSYNFLNRDRDTRALRNVHYDVSKFSEAQQRLDDLRAANQYLDDNKPVINDTITHITHKIYQIIAFDPTSSDILELQKTHIHVLGLSYQRLRQATICIVNATKSSEELFQQRAQSIIEAAAKDFAPVPSSAFHIFNKEQDIDFKALPNRNVIIFLVNE
ncbi:MAG: porin family protein [Bacteroidaceae bacterium]|nr:porin family protein [Bacteroidaceae bacterium]